MMIQDEYSICFSCHHFQRLPAVTEIHDDDPLPLQAVRRWRPVLDWNESRVSKAPPQGPGSTKTIRTFCMVQDDGRRKRKMLSRVELAHGVRAYHGILRD